MDNYRSRIETITITRETYYKIYALSAFFLKEIIQIHTNARYKGYQNTG